MRVRSSLVLLAFCVALVAVLVGLHALGDGMLALPEGVADVGGWAASRDPLVATAALVRGLAILAAWYLLATTVLAAVAELVHVGSLRRASDRLAVAPIRRLARAACGATLAAAATVGPVGVAAASPGPGIAPPGLVPPSLSRVEEDPPGDDRVPDEAGAADEQVTTPDGPVATPDDPGTPADDRATISDGPTAATDAPAAATDAPATASDDPAAAEVLPDVPPPASDDGGDRVPPPGLGISGPTDATPTDATPTDATPPDAPPTDATPPAASAVTDGDHEVVAGDSFWSIAADELAAELGRPPTDAEVVPRWQAWIDANADRLAVPGDPDLLFPGQILVPPELDTTRADGGDG